MKKFPRIFIQTIIVIIVVTLSSSLFAQQYDDIKTLKYKLTQKPTDSSLMWVYVYVFKYYSGMDNDSALMYVGQGLQHFKKTGYKKGQVKMLCAIGDYEDIHGNSAPARDNYLEALAIAKSENIKDGMATAYNNLGAVECKIGDYRKAITYFIEAKKIFEAIGEKEGAFSALVNIATLYDTNKDSEKAVEYYKNAEDFSKKLPLSEYVLTLYINMGQFYFDHRDTTDALPYIRKGVKLSEPPKYMTVHIAGIMTLGEILYKYGRQNEGKKFLYEALALSRKSNLPDMEADLLINCANLIEDQNKDSSLAFLNRAQMLANITKNKPALVNTYKALSAFYEKENKFKESNKYLKLYYALNDSLFTIGKAKEIANVAAVYDLKLSNAKVNELEALNNRNRVQRNIIIGIAMLLIFLFVIVWFYYRKSLILNKTLESSRMELEELNAMKDKLFSVIGHDLRGPIGNIPPIIDMIEEEADIHDDHKKILGSLKEHSYAVMDTLDKLLLLGQSVMTGSNFNPVVSNPKSSIVKNIELVSLAADKKKIRIEDNTSPDIEIFADAGHFDFIMRNLLSNAIKFSYHEGKIEIDAVKNNDTRMVTFSIKDHGTGINEEALKHMFKATIKSTYGTASEKGTGIGLKLCEEFVTLNGGRIWVESKPGEGSVFNFSLKTGN